MPDASSDRPLEGCRLLLGVSGGIAAYKTPLLVRRLKKAGAEVQVLMTPDARRFVTPLTLGTLSGREVFTDIFPEGAPTEDWTQHVTLGRWADLFIIAPATAQTLAKLAGGFSDSMLTATVLSARCPLLVCPSMDRDIYAHPAVRANLERLQDFGYAVMPAAHGELASGLVGAGRLPEPEAIFAQAVEMLKGDEENTPSPFPHKSVLVTAGPTREHLDPVRVLTNPSTGTMGFALAAAAARRGARVTLISGPTALGTPPGVERLDVETAQEMHDAVQSRAAEANLVCMAAAVADYTPATPSDEKIKKGEDALTLHLKRTPDILAALGRSKRAGQQLLGFALETTDGHTNARRKLEEKNLDWIALNSPTEEGAGFGTDTNRVTLLHRDGRQEELPRLPKRELAEALLEAMSNVTP